jgi:hypothetical protein
MKPHCSRPGLGFCLAVALVPLLACQLSEAGSAMWKQTPINNLWNSANNWTPATVPGSADTATFAQSGTTGVYASGQNASEIVFSVGASAYSITTGHFTLSGAGVANLSGVVQNFIVPPSPAESGYVPLSFSNSAVAGSDVQYTLQAPTQQSFVGGVIEFVDNASAGSANLIMCNRAAIQVVSNRPERGGPPIFHSSNLLGKFR